MHAPRTPIHVKAALIAIPVLLLGAGGAWAIFKTVHDSLSQQRQEIATEWSTVEDALDQRAALIQKLADRVKSFPDAPESVLQQVADAHAAFSSGATPQDKMRANDRVSAALANLLLAMDLHPSPHRDASLTQLLDAIRSSDDRIATTRLKYNETLQHYNARIQSFPHNLVARLSGFGRNEAYFKTIQF